MTGVMTACSVIREQMHESDVHAGHMHHEQVSYDGTIARAVVLKPKQSLSHVTLVHTSGPYMGCTGHPAARHPAHAQQACRLSVSKLQVNAKTSPYSDAYIWASELSTSVGSACWEDWSVSQSLPTPVVVVVGVVDAASAVQTLI